MKNKSNLSREDKLSLAGRRAWFTRFKKRGLSDFQALEAAGMLENKEPERRKVLRFLLDNHGDTPMHLLSLPASRFALERMIYAERKDVKFTCLERDGKFIREAFSVFSNNAPGSALKPLKDGIARGRKVTLHNLPASEVGSLDIQPLTAVWFDGMGLLTSRDFLAFVRGLKKHIAKGSKVPAVFTLLQGRDDGANYKRIPGNRTSKRARLLVRILRKAGLTLDVKQLWDYGSDSGGPVRMFNVAGMLSRTVKGSRTGRVPYSWRLLTPEAYEAIKSVLSEHGLAHFLGFCVNRVRKWDADVAPDTVAQAELLRLLVACAHAHKVEV